MWSESALSAYSVCSVVNRIDPTTILPRPESFEALSEGVSSSLNLQPIGYIRTQKQVKFHARHQPVESAAEENVLELLPDCRYEEALQDLAGFSRIWLVWWFHRNQEWRPLVLPPRGPSKRRGVFATRSPHRPNPLGLTPVQLIRVEGRKLILGACDLVDGTPVFDIKPYIPAYDIFPGESAGWIEEVDKALAQPPAFNVVYSKLAETQAEWLCVNWQIDFRPRMNELLARDPGLHRARRITRRSAGVFVIGCGAWRAVFSVEKKLVTVQEIEAGYARRFLLDPLREGITERKAQLAYTEKWPERPPTLKQKGS